MIHSRLIPRRHTGAGRIIHITNGSTLTLFALAVVILSLPVCAFAKAQDNWDGWTHSPFHYTGQHGKAYPVSIPVEKTDIQLKYKGVHDLPYKCHALHNHVRFVDLAPSAALSARVPQGRHLENGKAPWLTRHDIHRQYRRRPSGSISAFGAPYPKRLAFCYRSLAAPAYEACYQHIVEVKHAKI